MMPLALRLSGKKKWVLVGVVALLLAVGGYWLYQQGQQSTQPATSNPEAGSSSKASLPDNQTPATSDQIPAKQGVTVTIARVEQSGGNVVIEGDVTGAADGKCVAEFTTPQDNPVIGEANLTQNNTKCGPVTLPSTDFAYLGDWSVKLTVYTGGGKAESPAKTITIK